MALTRLGGIAPWREVRALTTRSQLARGHRWGEVVRLPRHVLSLPGQIAHAPAQRPPAAW